MGVIGDSAVPAFQDKLLEQLRARPALLTVSITCGPPSAGVAQQQQWIALLECTGTENWASLGRLQKQEIYEQSIYISVITRDGEGDAVRSRNLAFAFRKEIANQLIADPTVGGTVWQAQLTGKNDFFPRLGIQVPDVAGGTTTDLSWREAAVYTTIKFKNRI